LDSEYSAKLVLTLRFTCKTAIFEARPAGFEPATRGLEVRKAASKDNSGGVVRQVETA
jgi:hypothetical protein